MNDVSKWFRGLRGKLLLMVALPVILLGGVAFFSLSGLSRVGSGVDELGKSRIPITAEVGALRTMLNASLRYAWKAAAQRDAKRTKEAAETAREKMKAFDESMNTIAKMNTNERTKELLASAASEWKVLRKTLEESYALEQQEAIRLLNEKADEPAGKLTETLREVDSISETRNSEIIKASLETRMQVERLVSMAGFIGILTLIVFGISLAAALTKLLTKIANRLSAGADEVASAAAEISATSEELSSSATEQASSLQETSSSVEEMNAMVNKNADNANKSREVANEGLTSANNGKQVVEEMIQAVEEINQSNGDIMAQIEQSNQQISDIVKVIAEIGDKTKVINDIVFQTKLLSFNASVEAARAGEHGKGFAVVAEEVGNLAQMSGNAAKEISAMLDGSIQKVENIVADTKVKVEKLVAVGKSKVETGTQVAKRCGDVLDELVRNVGSVNGMVTEISTASQEQSRGIEEINKAMTQLDQVTQQNAAASEQAASSSEELARQAEVLRGSVQELLLAVNGKAGTEEHGQTMHHEAKRLAHPEPRAEAKVVQLPVSRKEQANPKSVSPAVYKKTASGEVPSGSDARFDE